MTERGILANPLLVAKFPFLRDDVFLIAQVEVETGKQTLRMQKVDLKTGKILLEDALDCIHAVICDIPVSQFADITNEDGFEEKILHIRSSEQLKEINLEPEERFLAFRSWVAGIAEAGINAFEIQGEIDTAAHLQYPVTNRLLRFLARIDSAFISTYLDYVDRTASYEGVRHRAYLVASLLPILEGLVQEPKIPDGDQVLRMIFALEPPFELFNNNWPLFRKLAENYPGFLPQYISRVHDEYQKKRGGGEEWLSVVLCPVLDSFDWAGDSNETQRKDLWKQIVQLDPPPELFSAYGTLFRYFVIRDPSFLPQYMRRVKLDRADKRSGDDIWLSTVLRPVFIVLDFLDDAEAAGGLELWQDILALTPPIEFLINNWATVLKHARKNLRFLHYYLAWVRQLKVGKNAGNDQWLASALHLASDSLNAIGTSTTQGYAELWKDFHDLETPVRSTF